MGFEETGCVGVDGIKLSQHMNKQRTVVNFTFKGPCIVKYMPIIIQQDATTRSLFISVNCSTCFEWYLHPSSGAHVTIFTASGISKTVTATCCERDWTGNVNTAMTCRFP